MSWVGLMTIRTRKARANCCAGFLVSSGWRKFQTVRVKFKSIRRKCRVQLLGGNCVDRTLVFVAQQRDDINAPQKRIRASEPECDFLRRRFGIALAKRKLIGHLRLHAAHQFAINYLRRKGHCFDVGVAKRLLGVKVLEKLDGSCAIEHLAYSNARESDKAQPQSDQRVRRRRFFAVSCVLHRVKVAAIVENTHRRCARVVDENQARPLKQNGSLTLVLSCSMKFHLETEAARFFVSGPRAVK